MTRPAPLRVTNDDLGGCGPVSVRRRLAGNRRRLAAGRRRSTTDRRPVTAAVKRRQSSAGRRRVLIGGSTVEVRGYQSPGAKVGPWKGVLRH